MNINATLFVQALSFAFLIWFSVKFIWPPLTRAIEERNKRIADGLAAAEKGKASLAEAERSSQAAMKEARERASGVLGESEKRGVQIVDEARLAAKAEADRIVAGAREQIAAEVAKARTELRDQVARLAIAGAEKILQREVDAKAHADMLNKLKAEL
jgi:F-type H+-transporting ATPase subunit b